MSDTVAIALVSFLSSIVGGTLVAGVNWLATRKRTAAETEKLLAEAERQRIENEWQRIVVREKAKAVKQDLPGV